jgi:hypothetical protein
MMLVSCLALGGALGNEAKAQNILYQVGNATPVSAASEADFEIDVGTVEGKLLVRVWDPALVNGVPDDDEQTGFCCLNPCDPDYNRDGNADQEDVAYLVATIASGYSPSGRDPDFNADGNVDQDDVAALVNTVGGGGCP